MTHDLIFYQGADQAGPAESKILEVLDRLPHTTRNGERGDYQFLYENRETGVEFSIVYRDPDNEASDGEIEYQFADFAPVGVVMSLNYLRPSFFGLEAMPWGAFIASGLGLTVLDPQAEGASRENPATPDPDALFASWDAANTRATQTLLSQEGIALNSGDRQHLQAWWRYRMIRPDLEARYGHDRPVLLPRLVADQDGNVCTVVSWSYGGPAVVPADVDFVHVERERRKFGFLNVVERGTMRADDLRAAAGAAFERVPDPLPHDVFDPGRLGEPERTALARVPVDVRSRYEPVVSTRLSDVPLP